CPRRLTLRRRAGPRERTVPADLRRQRPRPGAAAADTEPGRGGLQCAAVTRVLEQISGIVWGPCLLIPLLLLTGLYLTALLRGLQFRTLGWALWYGLVRRREDDADGDITHYQALTTALAATVGVGNIAGVATAIHLGGPGAVFWMWVTGLVGMATKYCEAFLGVRFRRVDEAGEQVGGPQTYLREAVPGRVGGALAVAFAIAASIAAFGIGNMVQSNTVAHELQTQFGVPAGATGLVLMLLTGVVLLGGIRSIGRVTSLFVPLMVGLYLLGASWVLAVHAAELPATFALIFSDAFTGTAA